MKRILILRGGAVGDFVVTLPVFAALRRQWPATHLTLAAYPRVKRLALETGLADSFLSLDAADIARLFAPTMGRRTEPGEFGLPASLTSFDLILSYLHDPDGVVRTNLAQSGARRTICVPPLPAPGRHAVDHLLAPLTELDLPVSPEAIPILDTARLSTLLASRLADRLPASIESLLTSSHPLVLHPGSGSPKKNWPPERFAELARAIRDRGLGSPVFSFGEADDAVSARLAGLAPEIPSMRGLDLADLAGLLARCSGYVGNDSGITHLAAAAGIPVVALFGPSDPAVWGPRGRNVNIIRAAQPTPESLAAIPVDKVLAAARRQAQARQRS